MRSVHSANSILILYKCPTLQRNKMALQFFSKFPKCHTSLQTAIHLFSTFSPPFPSFRSLKSAIKSESDPVKLAHLLSSSPPFAIFRRHRPLFHLSIQKLAHSQRFDLIDKIIATILKKPPPQQLNSEVFWIRMMATYAEAGMVDSARQLFDEMLERKPCPFTENSLCAILSVYLDNKICDHRFHELFELVPAKMRVSPGVKSYNLALRAFCEAKDVGKAQALLAKMEEARVVPDIDSYNILLGAYLAKRGKRGFDGVVKEILKRGLEGNLITYNYMILRVCKSKKLYWANKLLDEMISKGLKPNSATYDAIIFGFCRVGDFESAKKVLERMISDAYVTQPSFAYFTLMRHMVVQEEFDLALETCREILRRRWIPPFEAMEGLVNGLVKILKIKEAKEVVEEMKKRLRGTAVDSWGKVEAGLPL